MRPHKHAELIKAWADGAQIQQYRPEVDEWRDCCPYPVWDERLTYRVKPVPREIIKYVTTRAIQEGICRWDTSESAFANLRLVFNYYTGELKSAEVLK